MTYASWAQQLQVKIVLSKDQPLRLGTTRLTFLFKLGAL